jgi:hypothetical protein
MEECVLTIFFLLFFSFFFLFSLFDSHRRVFPPPNACLPQLPYRAIRDSDGGAADLNTSTIPVARVPELGAALEASVEALNERVQFGTLVACCCVEGGKRGYGLQYIAVRDGETVATGRDVGINTEVHAFLAEDWQRAAGQVWDEDGYSGVFF